MLNRILTTHAGSLPRTRALTNLLAVQSTGREVEPALLLKETIEAERIAIQRQLECGVDIVNSGEGGRESFFTYVRHRMSGFSGSWQRPMVGDAMQFPGYLAMIAQAAAARESFVNPMLPREATGAISYVDRTAIDGECARLQTELAPHQGRYVDAFVSAPSPGIVATAMANRHYDSMADYVAAVGRALAVEYRAILDAGFILQIDAPDLALERHTLFADKPLSVRRQAALRLPRFLAAGDRHHQRGAGRCAARPGAPARLLGQL
jgi:5-methyltetrahydropteroyltriglutamate--homocysteine methyltransferase